MLWRLFMALGLYSQLPYGDVETMRDPSEIKLDPITVAHHANIDTVKVYAQGLGFSCALEAIGWLSDVEELWVHSAPTSVNHHQPISTRYRAHIIALQEAKILKPSGSVRYVSGYFAVAKDPLTARSIFNGRKLSQLMHPPPNVNIPTIQDILALLISMTHVHTLCAFTMDIRHWFHQISVKPSLSQFFGLNFEGVYYEWTTLPMGWSYSPRICQCIAWTVIAFNANPSDNSDGLKQAREDLKGAKDPPRFVRITNLDGASIGFVTLTYDNVGVFCTDAKIARVLWTKIKSRFGSCNIVLKDKSLKYSSGSQMNCDSPRFAGLEYLGVQYAVKHIGVDEAHIRWRHDPERVKRWQPLLAKICAAMSAREAAQVCGVLIWNRQVKRESLCHSPMILESLRITASHVGGVRTRWALPVPNLTEAHLEYLRQELNKVIALNEWQEQMQGPPRIATRVMFTDASKDMMGCVIYDETDHKLSGPGTISRANVWSNGFPRGLDSAIIFLKELAGAVWYVQSCIRRFKWKNVHILLGVDNSAAYYSIVNMYSSNKVACEWLCRLDQALVSSGCTLEPFLVISQDNPADTPSRGMLWAEAVRPKHGWRAAIEHTQGRRFASTEADKNTCVGQRNVIDGEVLSRFEEHEANIAGEAIMEQLSQLCGEQPAEDAAAS
jgi:hypothetical protein